MMTLRALILAIAIAVAFVASSAAQQGDQPALVGVDAVRLEPLAQTVPLLGRLIPRRSGVVAARTQGPVAMFAVEVGDHVETGQVIATLNAERTRLDAELRQAEVAQARAAKRTAQAQAALLRQELTRINDLRKSAAFSQARYDDKKREYETALSSVAEAEASIARSRAALARAQVDIRDSEIRAPYSGVITERHTELGAWVMTGAAVVTLLDNLTLEIEVDVPSNRVGGLEPGTRVGFDLGARRDIAATVRAVVPNENPLTRTRAVRLTPRFESAEDVALAANQSVTLYVPVGSRREVVTVHKDAVLTKKGKRMVFKVIDGAARPQPIDVGLAVGNRFVVESGLEVGDMVVVRGNERLRPGQAVASPGPLSEGTGS